MPRMKSIIAYNGADAGLGNRVRVTIGAANLADSENRSFYYVWPRSEKFQPAFDELWDWERGRVVSRAFSRGLAKATGYYNAELTDIRKDADRRVWQIRTGAQLQVPDDVTPWYETFRTLTPSPAIQSLVTGTFDASLRGRAFVGVQVRAHAVSHHITKESSPLEWYTNRMDEFVREHGEVAFYISCDVPEVKRDLLAKYPGSVALETNAPYNSTEAVQYAVADLYLLASSNRILGPHYSSFVEMAEFLSHPDVETEKPSKPEIATDWTTLPLTVDPLHPRTR